MNLEMIATTANKKVGKVVGKKANGYILLQSIIV